ncbi:hypothetical protein SAMN05446635_9847 [Burkholderia sp. OK233]|nr:hypothetical protein SAMN05446635_9847 [Burkholderia sp. OK233]
MPSPVRLSEYCTREATSREDRIPLEISERFLRDFIKVQLPRLVRSRTQALLVEEMEVCLGRARVDLAVIADRLIGIEIKGPKDDVTRLPGQVQAYSKCFDRVVLVVHESLVEKARPLIPAWWGVVVSSQRDGEFAYWFERRPRPNPSPDMDAVLSLLWRDEIDGMLADLLGTIPKPRATKKTIRSELLEGVDLATLHAASLNRLRNRNDWRGVPVHCA